MEIVIAVQAQARQKSFHAVTLISILVPNEMLARALKKLEDEKQARRLPSRKLTFRTNYLNNSNKYVHHTCEVRVLKKKLLGALCVEILAVYASNLTVCKSTVQVNAT